MRILWQSEHYPDAVKGGGGAINTHYIVKTLTQLGHPATILAAGPAHRGLAWETVDGEEIIRVPPPGLPPRLWPIWPLIEPRYLRPTVAAIAARFDAFVCHDAAYGLSFKALYPAAPVVYRIVGARRIHDAAVPPAPLPRRRSFSERKRHLVRRFMAFENDLMDQRAWRRGDAMVVQSDFMRRDLATLYGLRPERVHVIPSGVDHARYAEARPTPDVLDRLALPGRDTVVIAFSGRLVRMKNVPYLLRAFALMGERQRALLAVAGDGEQRASLEDEARALGIADRVRFLGHVNRIEQVLAAAHIFVLSSTYEPFGNALIEAMAAGLPCLALRPDASTVRVAAAEIISHDRTGYLVDGADPGDLARHLDTLVRDPARRARIGAAAQACARERYDWAACARAFLTVIDSAIPGTTSSGRGPTR